MKNSRNKWLDRAVLRSMFGTQTLRNQNKISSRLNCLHKQKFNDPPYRGSYCIFSVHQIYLIRNTWLSTSSTKPLSYSRHDFNLYICLKVINYLQRADLYILYVYRICWFIYTICILYVHHVQRVYIYHA